MDVLVVVDMQNDFITGSLGTKEAQEILPKVMEKVSAFEGLVLFTRDTHEEDYLTTQEGKNLPIAHCIKNTQGWEIQEELQKFQKEKPIDKDTFGSTELMAKLSALHFHKEKIDSITFVGLCTDICVISNALMIKAALPEVPIIVDADCCAGVTPESHHNALQAMKSCQVIIEE